MRVSVIGEVGLLERIRTLLPPPSRALLGIGDDCAVLRPAANKDLLLTTDLLVDHVDFTQHTVTPFFLGRKAMGVNLSDIAAMGGLPRAALITLALPPDTEIETVVQLYRGLQEEGTRYSVDIVGGDLSASSTLMIGVTLLGEVEPGKAVTRAGARPGERIWVTGRLGASAAGLAALGAGFRLRDGQVEAPREVATELEEAIRKAIERHWCPTPRVAEGQALAQAGVASAMIDLSDGLATDLRRLCRESGVSAKIMEARIPVDPVASAIGRYLGKEPIAMALEGGEDFELLFTSSSDPAVVHAMFGDELDVTEVGAVEEAGLGCLLVTRSGVAVPLAGGYNHFRRA